MSAQPIGFFDSGVGGLTVMREVAKLLPHERLIYLGDTARLPYGNKSPDAVRRFALENAQFLLQHDIKLLVIACHTACCHALDLLQTELDVPVIGVTMPGLQAVLQAGPQRVAVLGTASTIASGHFQALLRAENPQLQVHGVACPLFVPLVEEGMHAHSAAQLIAEHYLGPLRAQRLDAALLACTHYPLLAPVIQEALGPGVRLVLPAEATAHEVRAVLQRANLLNAASRGQPHSFYASDDPEKFRRMAALFFPQPIERVELITPIFSCE